MRLDWTPSGPAHGRPLAVPSQDMVLGGYYLTMPRDGAKGEGKAFSDVGAVELALHHAERLDVGAMVDLQPAATDPYDPYAVVRVTGAL